MKLLYVITKSEIGGAQSHVRALASAARAAGHEVILACGQAGWLTEEMARLGIRTVELHGLRRSWNPLTARRYKTALRRLLAAERPDVVHFHSSNAMLGLRTARRADPKPLLVATVHGLSLLHPGWKKSSILKSAYRIVLRHLLAVADRVVFVCRADLHQALAQRLVRPENAIVIPNGTRPHPPLLPRAEARQRLNLPPEGFVFGAVSRFEYAKNVSLLVRAFGQAKLVAQLALIGTGPEEQAVRAAAAEAAPESIIFAGAVAEASRYLKALDVLVLPSRYEGLPYAVLEAMAAGVPVIASAVGGVPELIENGETGLLVPPENPEALADALNRLFSDPALAASLALAAHTKVATEFSEQKMTDATLRLYKAGVEVLRFGGSE